MTGPKPGTVTGIQAILWILAALGAFGDVITVAAAVSDFTPWSLAAIAWATYIAVQGILSPVHIARGKRWAWIWTLVSAIIGLVAAAALTVLGAMAADLTPVPLVLGLGLAGLYGTLLGLLCSRSARGWILMHRIQRGEVRTVGVHSGLAQGAPGAATITEVEAERPDRKPAGVTAVQSLMWLVALSPLLIVWVLRAHAEYEFHRWPGWRSAADSNGHFVASDQGLLAMWTVVGVVLVAALVIATVVGLQRGRLWARVAAAVWLGLAVAGAGFWIAVSMTLHGDFADDGGEFGEIMLAPLRIMLVVSCCVFVAALAAFLLTFTRGVRAWTPAKLTVVDVQGPRPPHLSPPPGRY